MKAVVFPVWPVLCVCAILIVPVSAAAQKSGACGDAAIRAAAAKQVAPRLVGCRYDEVAVPLVRYFSIFPTLTKTPGDRATSTILEQQPAAGEPLAAGGQLALNVSVGRSPAPELSAAASAENPAVSRPARPQETPPAGTKPADPPDTPVKLTEFVAASEAASENTPEIAPESAAASMSQSISAWAGKGLSVVHMIRPGLLWVWIGIIAVVIAVALVFRGRRKRSEYEYERVPKVTARLEYGPGRLNANGPLIVGFGGIE
jgi:hypothetical protein